MKKKDTNLSFDLLCSPVFEPQITGVVKPLDPYKSKDSIMHPKFDFIG